MTQTTLETNAAHLRAVLVEMSWGDPSTPTIARYTTWTDDLVFDTHTFQGRPSMEVVLGANTGVIDDKPSTITAPRTLEPFSSLLPGFRHAPVTVRIWKADPRDVGGTARLKFIGKISKTAKNAGGKGTLVKVSVSSVKSDLSLRVISMPATPECQNRFGGRACRKDASSSIRTLVISAIRTPESTCITLAGSGSPATVLDNDIFEMGYVTVEGLSIPIKRSRENWTIDLFTTVPASWAGKTAKIVPGCNKTIARCRFWNNESRFNGLGAAIPAYNPLYEQ